MGCTSSQVIDGKRLLEVCAVGQIEEVRRLLQMGVDIDYQDQREGWTALINACRYAESPELVHLLLTNKPKPKLDAQNMDGDTALMWAVYKGSKEIVQELLTAGASYSITNNNQRTALTMTTAEGNGTKEIIEQHKQHCEEIVESFGTMKSSELAKLIASGDYWSNIKNHTGQTLLMMAVIQGDEAKVDILLTAGVDLEKKDKNGCTALHLAVQSADLSKLREAEAAQKKRVMSPRFFGGGQNINVEVSDPHQIILDKLLQVGAFVNAVDNDGSTALSKAVEKRYESAYNSLFKHNADANIKDKEGIPPLMKAFNAGSDDVVLALLNHGATPNFSVRNTAPILLQAVASGNITIVNALLTAQVNLEEKDTDGATALIKAVECPNGDIFKKLLEAGAKVNAKNNDKENALLKAVEKDKIEFVRLLLEHNSQCNETDEYGFTPLTKAFHKKFFGIAKLLLQHGADPNIFDEDSPSLLFQAVGARRRSTLKLLLEAKANVNYQDKKGDSALSKALQDNDTEAANMLLDHHATVELKHVILSMGMQNQKLTNRLKEVQGSASGPAVQNTREPNILPSPANSDTGKYFDENPATEGIYTSPPKQNRTSMTFGKKRRNPGQPPKNPPKGQTSKSDQNTSFGLEGLCSKFFVCVEK